MGVTTRTASVTPAANPAMQKSVTACCGHHTELVCSKFLTLPKRQDCQGNHNAEITPWRGACVRTQERRLSANIAFRIRKQLLVPFVARKADCHLRDDASEHGAETLVETKGSFAFYDL
jgi:hypothetical protein